MHYILFLHLICLAMVFCTWTLLKTDWTEHHGPLLNQNLRTKSRIISRRIPCLATDPIRGVSDRLWTSCLLCGDTLLDYVSKRQLLCTFYMMERFFSVLPLLMALYITKDLPIIIPLKSVFCTVIYYWRFSHWKYVKSIATGTTDYHFIVLKTRNFFRFTIHVEIKQIPQVNMYFWLTVIQLTQWMKLNGLVNGG